MSPASTAHPTAETHASVGLAVEARKLGRTIDDRRILRDLSFTIEAGRYVALLGANGAGKSTLLKVLATLHPFSHGELLLFGRSVTRESADLRARLGLIGHGAMLYRDLTALENLVFFGRLYEVTDPKQRAMELLEYVNLQDRAADPVKTFSRGMTQRVSIARALMHDPDLLLADEPFAGLDAPSSRMLENMLKRLHEQGKTIILANHDIEQSLALSEQAIVLRQGRLVIDRPSAELDAEEVLTEVSGP